MYQGKESAPAERPGRWIGIFPFPTERAGGPETALADPPRAPLPPREPGCNRRSRPRNTGGTTTLRSGGLFRDEVENPAAAARLGAPPPGSGSVRGAPRAIVHGRRTPPAWPPVETTSPRGRWILFDGNHSPFSQGRLPEPAPPSASDSCISDLVNATCNWMFFWTKGVKRFKVQGSRYK